MATRFLLRDERGRFQKETDWFRVTASGPIFNGTAKGILRDAERAMSEKVAKAAQRHIQTLGRRDFRYNAAPATHFYENNIEVDRVSDGHLVHANQVIYGPWIEGTSSRNQSSRFKGYHLFRRAAQEVQNRLGDILSEEELKLARGLNGTGVRTGPRL